MGGGGGGRVDYDMWSVWRLREGQWGGGGWIICICIYIVSIHLSIYIYLSTYQSIYLCTHVQSIYVHMYR